MVVCVCANACKVIGGFPMELCVLVQVYGGVFYVFCAFVYSSVFV